ncbi:MAG: hypothetical protein QOH35_2753 [Acidobacteriaceae bacterium]|jgi:hypothetical protein|nr:hypothetical protein [Acidobacteriaceae bacterium]MEA3008294.1 hypothetical protein [Acidobacteriaceae bacterium]
MARSRRTPAMLVWQMLFGAFQPQSTREIKKATSSERTRISYLTVLTGYHACGSPNTLEMTL